MQTVLHLCVCCSSVISLSPIYCQWSWNFPRKRKYKSEEFNCPRNLVWILLQSSILSFHSKSSLCQTKSEHKGEGPNCPRKMMWIQLQPSVLSVHSKYQITSPSTRKHLNACISTACSYVDPTELKYWIFREEGSTNVKRLAVREVWCESSFKLLSCPFILNIEYPIHPSIFMVQISYSLHIYCPAPIRPRLSSRDWRAPYPRRNWVWA